MNGTFYITLTSIGTLKGECTKYLFFNICFPLSVKHKRIFFYCSPKVRVMVFCISKGVVTPSLGPQI